MADPPLEPAGGWGVEDYTSAHRKKILFSSSALLRSLRRSAEGFGSRRTFGARLAHLFGLFTSRFLRSNTTTFSGDVGIQARFLCRHYFLLDFVPAHFQRFRERRSGLFGFLAAFGCFFIWPALRAQ